MTIICYGSHTFKWAFTLVMREVLVLKKILQKLISLKIRFVFVKIDLKLVVDHLTSNNIDLNEFDLVIEDC